MMELRYIACSVLVYLQLVSGQRCPSGWTQSGESCFYATTDSKTWFEAESACQSMDADLVAAKTLDINTFIFGLIAPYGSSFWIGLHDQTNEGVFIWPDGTVLDNSQAPWNGGNPDNFNDGEDCVEIINNGLWNDLSCTENRGYICQRSNDVVIKCDEGDGWASVGSKCYKFYNYDRTWSDASNYCNAVGAELISVQGTAEQDFVTINSQYNSALIWIGATDTITGVTGSYTWSNGDTLGVYTNWDIGQPDNRFSSMGGNCVEVLDTAGNGEWSTAPCSSTRKYICEKDEGTCPPGWRIFRGNCYQFNTFTKTTWSDAKHTCEAQGTFLVSILSVVENDFIASQFEDLQDLGITDIWIGASDYVLDAQFIWSEGSPIAYQNWNTAEPINHINQPDCGTIFTGDSAAKWSSTNCFNLQAFVCKTGVGNPVTPLQPDMSVGNCPIGWSLNGDYCYYVDTTLVTFADAETACESKGAMLTSIHDDDEQTYHSMRANMAGMYLWIGLHDRSDEGNFEWVDGTPVDFLNWNGGQPDNWGDAGEDCAHMYWDEIGAGVWNDLPCTATSGYMCKKAKECEQVTAGDTDDDYYYRYHPSTVNLEMFEFEVKASNDVHIALTSAAENAPEMYEIVIGGWGNAQSVIRRCAQCGDEATVSTPGYLSANEFRGFWISYDQMTGEIQVGREANAYFMRWQDPNPLDVKYIGYSTGFGSTGVFKFCNLNSGVDATPKPNPTPVFDARCGTGWEFDDTTGQCFLFRETDYRTWDDARQQCKIGGGDLVSITNPQEQAYLSARTALSTEWALWIGANDLSLEGGWQWSDGAPFRYLNWNSGEPNNFESEHCAELYVTNGMWNDNQCENKYGYICKKNGYIVSHFTVSPNAYLDAYNRLHLTNVYPDECAKRCVEETAFNCLSFDYDRVNMECDLSDSSKTLIGNVLSSPDFDYYEKVPDASPPLPLTTLPPTFRCDVGWVGYGSNCYHLVDMKVTWQAASSQCRTFPGADLLSIHDKNENEFILSMITSSGFNDKIWTGLTDLRQPNLYEWSDDSDVTYTFWDALEPNNYEGDEDCTELYYPSGAWNDQTCVDLARFICKRPKQDLPLTQFPITPSGCGLGWIGYDSSCYWVENSDEASWSSALSNCQGYGGSLVHIGDRFEQSVLTSQLGLQNGQLFWIGLSDTDEPGQYKWTDGNAVTYTHWDKGQPDNSKGDCVAATSGVSSGLWQDTNCDQSLNYVCETLRAGFTKPPMTQAPQPTPPDSGGCAPGWIGYGNNCFKVDDAGVDKTLTWEGAKQHCLGMGADLASFHSSEEEDYIVQIASATVSDLNAGYWFGLHDSILEGGFEWSDGSPVDYTNWAGGEPNDYGSGEDCGEMFFGGREWNDIICDSYRSWVCKIPKGITPVTTLPPPTPSPYPSCPNNEDWYLFNNNCYYFSEASASDARKSWKEANTYCMNNGGYLVSIHGSDENSYLTNIASTTYTVDSYWIGLREYAASGTYEWSDDSPLDFQMWSAGEPNDFNGEEECAQFYVYDGTWNDLNCGDRIPFICKKVIGNEQPITHAPIPTPPGYCPVSSIRYNNKCYWFNGANEADRLTWQEARDKCAEFGDGYFSTPPSLATIHTQEVQSFLNSHLQGLDHQMWIGLSDITNNNQFRWADGTAVDFTYWGFGEPSESNGEEDCVELLTNENTLGKWNDITCDKASGFICEHLPDISVPDPGDSMSYCREGYTEYYDSCFKVISTPQSFSKANDACKSDGTNLASIINAYEQAFVETLVHTTVGADALWIGLADDKIAGLYTWADGWPVWYTNWGQSEPSKGSGEGCVAVMYNGDWDDTVCSNAYQPLCKYSFLDTPTDPPPFPGICEEGWTAYGNSCYQYNSGEDVKTSWPEAEFYCTKQGAYVTSVHSKQENEWIRLSLAAGSTENIWNGLHRTDSGGFSWQDNSAVDYVNWDQNQPSYMWDGEHENCVEMYIDSGLWNDIDCLQKQSYVCKKPKTPLSTDETPVSQPGGGGDTKRPVTQPSNQSAQPQTGGMSSGGIIGVILGALILIVLAGMVVYFVVTRNSPNKSSALDIGSVGFDNALYSATKGTVQVSEIKKGNDNIAVIADPTMAYDPATSA